MKSYILLPSLTVYIATGPGATTQFKKRLKASHQRQWNDGILQGRAPARGRPFGVLGNLLMVAAWEINITIQLYI
ncbi:MAG: hypothetical protein ACOCXW_00640 [Bacteroidota bacterium]